MSLYDYRVIGKTEEGFFTHDEGPGSTRYADCVEVGRTEVEVWYGMDAQFALYILFLQRSGDLYLPPDQNTRYVIERKLSGSNVWEFVTDSWEEPSIDKLPEGFQSLTAWIEHYEKGVTQ